MNNTILGFDTFKILKRNKGQYNYIFLATKTNKKRLERIVSDEC